jgi:hypothetical protein
MNSPLIGGFGKEGLLGSQLGPEKAPLLVQSGGFRFAWKAAVAS